ncbi:MAG: hypothetical protein AB7F82_02720 [Alphaproteobacteria bacterium]
MPQKRAWSYIYHLDGRSEPNESQPASDCFYSLNVILGLAHAGNDAWQATYDLPALLHFNARQLRMLTVKPYVLGMALWASAALKEPLQDDVVSYISAAITDRRKWKNFSAQDAGMILTGLCEQKRSGFLNDDTVAPELLKFILRYYHSSSSLFHNNAGGLRRNYASFASQAYLLHALYAYGETHDNKQALKIADDGTKRMLRHQGEDGNWPWFYHAPSGNVVDRYELYSVHQHGMGTLFLYPAIERNIEGASEALDNGFAWLFGNNILRQDMLAPQTGMILRSIARSNELNKRYPRFMRAKRNRLLGQMPEPKAETLTLRRECRSYELGWLLYGFANSDRTHITHHIAFGS